MPFSILPLLLLAVPIAEIAVFIAVGSQIGVFWTLACVFITAIIGTILLRIQGFQIINRLREETAAGRIPGRELGHGAMILVAGVLLLTPGFVTDTLGFLLFVPPLRDWLWRFLAGHIRFTTLNRSPMGDPSGRNRSGSHRRGPFGGPFDGQFGGTPHRDDGVVDLDRDDYRRTNDTGKETGSGDPQLSDDIHEQDDASSPSGPSGQSGGRHSPWRNGDEQ